MTQSEIDHIVEALEEKDIVLVTAPSEKVDEVNKKIIHHINSKDAKAVYLTVAKPYSTITNVLEEEGIDTEDMFFIDCITKTTSDAPERAENCVFLRPQALTDISIALSQAVESLPENGERFLVFDTLSTLMLYNDKDTVGKFAHSIVNKIRDWGIKSVMLTLEDEADEEVTAQITQFCDETIKISED